jgi:hypothetical protein
MRIEDSILPVTYANRSFVNPLGDWAALRLYSSVPLMDVDDSGECLSCVLCGALSTNYHVLLESIVQQSLTQNGGPVFGNGATVGDTIIYSVVGIPALPPSPPAPPTPPAA